MTSRTNIFTPSPFIGPCHPLRWGVAFYVSKKVVRVVIYFS